MVALIFSVYNWGLRALGTCPSTLQIKRGGSVHDVWYLLNTLGDGQTGEAVSCGAANRSGTLGACA